MCLVEKVVLLDYRLDKPITDAKDDLLNRTDFAKNIADAIISFSDTGDSVVFGLQGEWGSGKTSVARMIENSLKSRNKRIRTVRLETWLTTDRESLFKEFFTCILGALRCEGKLHAYCDDVVNYANQFGRKFLRSIDVNVGFYPVSLNLSMDKLIDEPEPQTLESRKQAINEKLKGTDTAPIVVFVDDIDRLSYDEIVVLFQLVKNIADFEKIIYVLCYDKDIVGNALERIHLGKGYKYIEKIIQIPIDIPMPGETGINNYFTGLLDKLLVGNKGELSQFDEAHWNDIFYHGIAKFLKNIRDCNRLYNSFALKYRLFGKECDFADLLAITFLENEAPAALKIIRLNKVMLLGNDRGFPISIKPEDANRLWNDINNSSSTLKDNEAFNCIVGALFPTFAQKTNLSHGIFSAGRNKYTSKIANNENFDRFFRLSLDDGEVSRTEVKIWLDCEKQEDLAKWIDIWRSEGKLENALQEANELIRSVDGTSYKVCTKEGFLNLLHTFSNQKFSRTAVKFLGVGESTLRKFIIYNILDLLLKSNAGSKKDIINCLFGDSSVSVSLKTIILEHFSAGYDWWFGSEVLRGSDKIINEEEFDLAQRLFMKCIYDEKEKDDFLYHEYCRWIIGIWKYMDNEGFKNYVMTHQSNKDLSKFALVCVDEGVVCSSAEPPYKQWSYRSSEWIEELDFDSTVEAVKRVLSDKTCDEFDNEKKIKLCAFLKFAEMKKEHEAEGKMNLKLAVRLEDFSNVCEEYGVL